MKNKLHPATAIIARLVLAAWAFLCLIIAFGCVGNNISVLSNQEAWKKIGTAEDFGKDNAARIGTAEKTKTTIKGDVNEKDSDDDDDSGGLLDFFKRGI